MKKLFAILTFALLALSACGARDTKYDAFAACLDASGAKFYGAYWCPHCQEQKALFGDSVSKLPYIECDASGKNAQPALCAEKNVKQYPTWIFADGSTKVGLQSIEDLAKQTSCALPGQESVMLQK